MSTFHIHIKGRVQGVGFRPFIYQLANANGIKGWVCNASDGVHIRFNSEQETAKDFYQQCLTGKPRLSVIHESSLQQVKLEHFVDFQITESKKAQLELSLSPDFALCENCRNEMHDSYDRRAHYPFITCTHCGPRYSILKGLPYDRPSTTMDAFPMCSTCEQEYRDPEYRRYYSQTNSCPTCGIKLSLSSSKRESLDHLRQSEMIKYIIEALRQDKIVAVKGIGGFLLLCDASSKAAIARLRSRKQRPSKPFAVLYPDFSSIASSMVVSSSEKASLLSAAAPIVLLEISSKVDLPIESIAPSLDRLGVMIPYAPLLELITAHFGNPLIATSANVSGSPILHEEVESQLLQLADFILSNNRPITFSQDDSVVQFTRRGQQQIILRRSRGLAPSIFSELTSLQSDMIALGAEMKGTFAVSTHSNTYVSQYLGNLAHYENQVQFEKVLRDFTHLVQVNPEQIVIDAHSGYFTHQLGRSMARERGIPFQEVQHHEAHFAAVLADRKLLEEDHILGVIWDGNGYGTDGNVWGGEFFDFSDREINRVAHIEYFGHLANDNMAKDNRLCALSLAGTQNRHLLKHHFTDTEWMFYTKSLEHPTLKTSSMGRVFDAIAFLAGISQFNGFEGQSAMMLEQEAIRYFKKHNLIRPYSISFDGTQVSLQSAINEIFQDLEVGFEGISARFHMTLVKMIKEVALQGNHRKIAFSGGVFQNGLLVDLLSEELGESFELHFHQELSPNDENIAYGQLAYLQILKNQKKYNFKAIEQCV